MSSWTASLRGDGKHRKSKSLGLKRCFLACPTTQRVAASPLHGWNRVRGWSTYARPLTMSVQSRWKSRKAVCTPSLACTRACPTPLVSLVSPPRPSPLWAPCCPFACRAESSIWTPRGPAPSIPHKNWVGSPRVCTWSALGDYRFPCPVVL
jgi:hypothetical protein